MINVEKNYYPSSRNNSLEKSENKRNSRKELSNITIHGVRNSSNDIE
jgi:hypothetical protein